LKVVRPQAGGGEVRRILHGRPSRRAEHADHALKRSHTVTSSEPFTLLSALASLIDAAVVVEGGEAARDVEGLVERRRGSGDKTDALREHLGLRRPTNRFFG